MRISSGNNNEEIDPEVIPWSSSDAGFLPLYLAGFAFAVFLTIPYLWTPYPLVALLPGIPATYLGYKSLRAVESHLNLKRLQKLYGHLKANK